MNFDDEIAALAQELRAAAEDIGMDKLGMTVHFTSPTSHSHSGSLRVGRRRRKGTPPPAVALTDARAANDLDEITTRLAEHGHTSGFTAEQIDKAEARRKVTFPEELRLFSGKVKSGTVLDEEDLFAEVVGGLTAGTGKLGEEVDGELPSRARLGDYVEKTALSPAEAQAAVELTILPTETEIDLSPPCWDPSRCADSLEHLAAPPWVWAQLAEQDAWPPALVTAEIAARAGTPSTEVAAANAILEHYGRDPIGVHTWRD